MVGINRKYISYWGIGLVIHVLVLLLSYSDADARAKAGQGSGVVDRIEGPSHVPLPLPDPPPPEESPLSDNCTATVLNRSVQINPNGTFGIPNVPADSGLLRMQITCTQDGVTLGGAVGLLCSRRGRSDRHWGYYPRPY